MYNMMEYYGYGSGIMTGVGLIGLITWVVIIVDLILLGFWLAKQLSKK